MLTEGNNPPPLFISYSHADGTYKKLVLKHFGVLAQQSKLEPWHDQLIGAGENWYQDMYASGESRG